MRARTRGRLAAATLSAVLAVLLGGCRHYGGDWARWRAGGPEPDAVEPDAIEILVLGHGREGRVSAAVVEVAAAELEAAAAAGRPALALWLGTDLGPPGPERSGRCPSDPPLPSAAAELGAAAARVGASVWGVPGPDLWRCGQALPERATVYQQPGLAYVVRVTADGRVELATRCSGDVCELVPADAPPRLELVVLDLSWWVFPGLADPTLEIQIEAQQRSLLASIAGAPAAPRILVSPIPVDSAGGRGLGGRRQRTGFRYLPDFVQQALANGLFIGSVGALERDLQISADLSDAIHRGDRSFVAAPVFGVVSGAAGGAGHTLPTSRASALLPDLWSEHPGLVSVRIGRERVELRMLARVAGLWREASVAVPLRPIPHAPLRPAPVIQPCPSCDPLPGASDGDVHVPRPARPR